jgi:hypothetical protein
MRPAGWWHRNLQEQAIMPEAVVGRPKSCRCCSDNPMYRIEEAGYAGLAERYDFKLKTIFKGSTI